MKITDIEFDPETVLGPADEAFQLGDLHMARSPGLHLSTIYQDIELTIGAQNSELSERDLEFYRAGGFLWERVMSAALVASLQTDDIVRPGEFERDGITGSPDLLDLRTMHIHETKCTWRSENKFDNLQKFFWSWLVQVQGYCHMLDTGTAILTVMFVNGRYAPPKPNIRRKQFEFTRRELSDNWLMLLNHARVRGWLT